MRVISFCADGIVQAADRGFYDWMQNQDADVICIQDIQTEEHKLRDDKYFPSRYNAYFFDNQEGTNGVAIYCKDLPKAIMTGMGFNDFDMEARYIQADFDKISFGSLASMRAIRSDSPAGIPSTRGGTSMAWARRTANVPPSENGGWPVSSSNRMMPRA